MPSEHPAIRVRNLSKRYTLGGPQEKYLTFRDAIVSSIRAPVRRLSSREPSQEFWALKDVSFDVEQGEVVGIIGRNGAGKSTLLKILSRITSPTEGTVDLYGRVGSLLEVGTGFHPELTGRENIYLSGSILGMKKREIDDRLDGIVKFSEIEKFLDTPAKRYSSGMYVRLAFAVAAHLEPEILLVDEVLAVGDAAFQKKCLGKMGEVAREGRTVLLVSHNMTAIQNISQRAIVFEAGGKTCDSTPDTAISYYLNEGLGAGLNTISYPDSSLPGDEMIRLKSVRISTKNDANPASIPINEDINIEITFRVLREIANYHNYIRISSESGLLLFGSGSWDGQDRLGSTYVPGTYISVCTIPGNLLNQGTFLVSVLGEIPHKKYFFIEENILKIRINELSGAGGVYSAARPGLLRPLLQWKTEKTG